MLLTLRWGYLLERSSHAVYSLGPLRTNQGLIREAEPLETVWDQGFVTGS